VSFRLPELHSCCCAVLWDDEVEELKISTVEWSLVLGNLLVSAADTDIGNA